MLVCMARAADASMLRGQAAVRGSGDVDPSTVDQLGEDAQVRVSMMSMASMKGKRKKKRPLGGVRRYLVSFSRSATGKVPEPCEGLQSIDAAPALG